MIELKTVRSMVYGLAVADALGVPVEFTSRARLRKNPVEGMKSGGVWDQPAGTWSDDTSMMIATMESIARLKKIDLDDIMNNFVEWFDHDEFTAGNYTFDIGNTTATAIERFLDGTPIGDCGLTSPNSNGNGSLMRIVPMAMYCYSVDGAELSEQSMDAIHSVSALTHAHARSQMACGIYCLIAAQLLDGKPIAQAVADGLIRAEKFYARKFPDEMKTYARLFDPKFGSLDEDRIESSGYVVDSLEAALWSLLNTTNYREPALKAVNLGGDTDTVGAIAGGLGGIAYGLDQIPSEWIDALRNKELLDEIAAKFFSAIER